MSIGTPRVHYRRTGSTNERARELAANGAPSGTLVTAAEQISGRGRQGRTWTAPAGRALLCSVIVRDPRRLLPLVAGLAVADVVGDEARLKWPNDVWVHGRKVAGILVEGRPQERWAVLGIGLNVAIRIEDFPPDLQLTAGTMGLDPDAIEPTLARLVASLEHWLGSSDERVIAAFRERDALRDREIRWASGEGRADGIDGDGRLVVVTVDGRVALDAGEVHLRV